MTTALIPFGTTLYVFAPFITVHAHVFNNCYIPIFIDPTINFQHPAYDVHEYSESVEPVLILSNPSSTDITISVFATDGTATGEYYFILYRNNCSNYFLNCN